MSLTLKSNTPLLPVIERKRLNDMLIMGHDVIRHTDGSRIVISRHAIFER
jgi:hypothetical protein